MLYTHFQITYKHSYQAKGRGKMWQNFSTKQILEMRRFLTSKFCFYFPNPTHNAKNCTTNRWDTTNNKPAGPLIMISQSETGSSSLLDQNHFAGLGQTGMF
jgi:hypothetical protein